MQDIERCLLIEPSPSALVATSACVSLINIVNKCDNIILLSIVSRDSGRLYIKLGMSRREGLGFRSICQATPRGSFIQRRSAPVVCHFVRISRTRTR